MTTDEAARLLGLQPATIKDYCARGILAAEKFGPMWNIPAAEVRRYQLERRSRGRPAAEPR